MAELEMLPAWAGRLAEPTPPPQPPTPPRRYASEDGVDSGQEAVNGDGPATGNGHGPSVLAGQPPLPSGEHRLEPAAEITSELPVVSIPFEDETTPAPETPVPPADSLIDTVEVPVDDVIVDAELVDADDELEGEDLEGIDGSEIDDAEIDDVELEGEEPWAEGLLDEDDQPSATHPHLDEIVYEPDEIELLEDTDPIGPTPAGTSPAVAPISPPDTGPFEDQGRPAERDRPMLRVLSLLALALLVVAAGVAAGYLFVALSGS